MVSVSDNYKMISRGHLEELTGLSRSTIYDRLNPNSKRFDANFPKPIKFGHLTRWRLSEVHEWIQSKIDQRNHSHKSV